jgi:shikimate kinase
LGQLTQFIFFAIRYIGEVSSPPVVFLVGFMGSGKSSVGRHLAPLLHVRFVDLDEQIAHRAGRPVHAIFAHEGEPAFRAHERAALHELESTLHQGAVIATGGGAFAEPDLRAWMLMRGTCVWLDATLDAIELRVARDGSRPLFVDRAGLERLHTQRCAAYAEAPLRFDTSATDAPAAARSLADRLRGDFPG